MTAPLPPRACPAVISDPTALRVAARRGAVGCSDATRYARSHARRRRRPTDRDATPVGIGRASPRGKDGTARRPPLRRLHRGRPSGRGSGGDSRRHHRQRRQRAGGVCRGADGSPRRATASATRRRFRCHLPCLRARCGSCAAESRVRRRKPSLHPDRPAADATASPCREKNRRRNSLAPATSFVAV